MKSLRSLFLVAIVGSSLALRAQTAGYHLLRTIPLEGDGAQDYLAIDPDAHRLYVSHFTEVVVLDLDSEKVIGKIGGMDGVHGIAPASALGRGFITSGNTSTVKMVDLKTLVSLADIPAGKGPDGVVYEPVTRRVFAFNHRGGTLTVIDAVRGEAIKTLELGGQPEFPVVDGQGTVWDIIEDKSTLIRLDAKTLEITGRWPLAPGGEPSGMAFDAANRRLFIGCNSQVMVVADADKGTIVANLPIGVHVDATAYDPRTKLIFNANRGSVTIIHQDSPDHYSPVGTVESWPHANTLALDLKTGRYYQAASRYTEQPAVAPGGKPKSVKVPGSFAVLVFGP